MNTTQTPSEQWNLSNTSGYIFNKGRYPDLKVSLSNSGLPVALYTIHPINRIYQFICCILIQHFINMLLFLIECPNSTAICRFDPKSNYTHGIKEQRELRGRLTEHVKTVSTDPHHPLHNRYTDPDFIKTIVGEDETMNDFLRRFKNGWGGYSDLTFMANLLNIEFRMIKGADQESLNT
jgi:hypothetical protein